MILHNIFCQGWGEQVVYLNDIKKAYHKQKIEVKKLLHRIIDRFPKILKCRYLPLALFIISKSLLLDLIVSILIIMDAFT